MRQVRLAQRGIPIVRWSRYVARQWGAIEETAEVAAESASGPTAASFAF